MQADTLHLLQSEAAPVESWDEDGDLQCLDDIHFQPVSTTTSVTGSVLRSGHRDSVSSRLSVRSDADSNVGDEDWQVLLRDNDETATEDAIASARNAGIPIPGGISKSALMGGAIKKLQSKHIRKTTIDDWSEDLEFPANAELSLKSQAQELFPETLQHINNTPSMTSPAKPHRSLNSDSFREPEIVSRTEESVETRKTYEETDQNGEVQDVPTIKIAKSHLHEVQITTRTGDNNIMDTNQDAEDFEKDFELSAENSILKLSAPKDIAITTPEMNDDGWDIDWAEGSIGVRFGGTRRDGRSTHSSSISAFSPSISSCLTAESEDDGLDGLVLPDGPLDFGEALKKRQEVLTTPDISPKSQPVSKESNDHKSFFDNLDIGDGNVFASMKQSVNRNVKRKIARPETPSRSEKTITFTNKTPSSVTRIPRLSGHDRSHSNLEPVSESGAPITKFRRPQSRLAGHATRSSVPSIHNSHTSPPSTPSRPRRSLGSRISTEAPRNDTTTSSQLLKAKRSISSIRPNEQSNPITPFQRPSSRQDGVISLRPKTPVDRSTTDSRLPNRRGQVPFLPAGASTSQSHHASVKYSRYLRRSDSDDYTGSTVGQKSATRFGHLQRSETPNAQHRDSITEYTNVTAKRTVTRPAHRRNYGDGTELESFDDLPTSAVAESRFVKSPVGHGAPRSIRSRLAQTPSPLLSRTETPVNILNSSRPSSFTPRFARDTNASRNAREQRIASLSVPSRDRGSMALTPLSTNWKGPTLQEGETMLTLRSKKGKLSRTPTSRPQLIRPMGSGVSGSRQINGMQYNPATYRWEGNENTVAEFDIINRPKTPKAAPALITSIGATKDAQVVGNMVFDPQRMCWQKVASTLSDPDGGPVVSDESEDVFAGLDDLQEKPDTQHKRVLSSDAFEMDGSDEQSGGDSGEEWPITEEFDVGPEFVKRQRAEEDRWKRKVTKWVSSERQRFGDGWRWAIRDLVPTAPTKIDPLG
ncbi:putative cytokinesis regulator [Talaromyces proteolyticus]|uniref:Cytokinesis regulator n=1 Tax=Talaromyces proteolyticus TaxID=1131652 RepID=A0AAD4Q332_9EURO|nr:putative cytokinesis regulator [Talaromyces proteolyticus]KAH8704282.1 putative cytokinesis regulator [Talaromyces proteolyticus]